MRPTILTPTRLLAAIAALTICCMLAVSYISERLAERYLTHNVIPPVRVHLIHEVITALTRARESRRAYLSTSDPEYILSYRQACTDVDSALARLLMQDQVLSAKISHAADLEDMVHSKLQAIADTLASQPAAKDAAKAPAIQRVTAEEDADLSRIGKLLDSVAEEETIDQSDALSAARARTAFHYHLMIALAVINGLFLAGVAICAIQIKKLQTLITMCAWSRRVQYNDQWIPLEEYLGKRFGIRFSHGISQEEYDKWAANPDGEPLPHAEASSQPAAVNPRAAA